MSFKCTIVTPEAQTFDQPASQVILPSHDGMLGVLTNRAPMLVKLGVGPLQIDLQSGGKSVYFYVEGGVAQMKDNKLTVLTHNAIPSAEITADAARAELASAENLPSNNPAEREKKTLAVKRAQAKVSVAGK